MKRKTIIRCAAAVLAGLLFCGCGVKKEKSVSQTGFALNTVIQITLYGTEDENLITDCFRLCNQYEQMFSRTIETSEIARLNKENTVELSDETAELLEKGLYYSDLSGGAFDITIEPISSLWDFTADKPALPKSEEIEENLPYVDYTRLSLNGRVAEIEPGMGVDLGAIAKGYIADRLKDYLLEQGVTSATINLGGNVLCVGEKENGDGFLIGIQNPKEPSKIQGGVTISDQSVVTSGDYERNMVVDGVKYHHILNPDTGYSYMNDVASVTIISDYSVDGDGLSTTCFSLGIEKGLELINSIDDVYAMFIDQNGNAYYSNGFEEHTQYQEMK